MAEWNGSHLFWWQNTKQQENRIVILVSVYCAASERVRAMERNESYASKTNTNFCAPILPLTAFSLMHDRHSSLTHSLCPGSRHTHTHFAFATLDTISISPSSQSLFFKFTHSLLRYIRVIRLYPHDFRLVFGILSEWCKPERTSGRAHAHAYPMHFPRFAFAFSSSSISQA